MVVLENDLLQVNIAPHGAELTSIFSPKNNIEYLWQADPQVWARHAPVLFPIVGKLEGGAYQYNNKTYQLPQHGFARDKVFSIVSQKENEVTLRLTEDAETLAVYPFAFVLNITYTLSKNTVTTSYEVVNTGPHEMLFSIGAHPAINCPLTPSETFEDYYLEFEKSENASRYQLEDGLQNGQTQPLLIDQTQLQLTTEIFKAEALVFKNLKSKKVCLKSKKSAHIVTMEFEGFPYFGIWTKPGSEHFICLEPWHGMASIKGSSSLLNDKERIIKLAKGEKSSCSVSLSFF